MMKLKSIEIDLNDCEAVKDDLKNVNGLCPLIHVTFDNNGKDKAFTGRLLAFSFQKGNPAAAGHFMFVYKSVQNGKTFTTYCHKEELKISAEDLYALVMQNFEKKSPGEELAEKLVEMCF